VVDGVILGAILVQSILAHVLFDYGATHSFISTNIIALHHISCDDMVNPWNITTKGGIVVCSKECRKFPIVICDREFLTDLIVINDSRFDVVFCMDWLGTSYALIDYRKKKVTFWVPSHLEFEFHAGDVTLEQGQFKKRQLKGVLEFLNSKEQVNIAEVACEFLDIFPEDPSYPLFERLDLVSKCCLDLPLFLRHRTIWLR